MSLGLTFEKTPEELRKELGYNGSREQKLYRWLCTHANGRKNAKKAGEIEAATGTAPRVTAQLKSNLNRIYMLRVASHRDYGYWIPDERDPEDLRLGGEQLRSAALESLAQYAAYNRISKYEAMKKLEEEE